MIAALRRWSGEPSPHLDDASKALGRYTRSAASLREKPGLALLAGQRDFLGSSDGIEAAFSGWIDNADEIAELLHVEAANPANLYAAALAAWGDDADRRIVGNYAAIAAWGDGRLRVARSPWSAPPLYYRHADGECIASPMMRVLFAAGTPRELDYERMVDELAFDWRCLEETAWHKGVLRVPLGATVTLSAERKILDRWYKPPVSASGLAYDEGGAVERARELLDEAASKALAWAAKPAVTLSAGLDSPLVTASLLESLPEGRTLPAITFVPDRRWDGRDEPGTLGDESALAGEFAAQQPRLDWHRASDDVGPFDRRAREIFAASEVFAQGLGNVGMMHCVYEKARELGCDTLLTADMGNATLSDAGRYGYCEYARKGRWGELVGLLCNRPGDTRPLWRKLLALSVLPHLPAALRKLARRLVHPARRDMTALLSPLSPEARASQAARAKSRGTSGEWEDFTHDRSRADAVAREFANADSSAFDVDLAFEQLYGIRKRDVMAYRPLVEFCFSLPLEAFARDGMERRLARLVGKGRIPEAIRTNRLHGQHNVDWHARMTPVRAEMIATLEAARDHPFLGEALDIDRLVGLIEDWPPATDFSWEQEWSRLAALPRAILAARYVGHVENRNDF
ncbi:hypothetical protein GRI42_11015 [Erythrobacter gaetbuli]|uniref:Asparagine synthetase domain-containing protein n=1 Tax=Qipengyuania gaetbuli TaxID=266952 RepID=A0A844Y441_9SPHN|nr:hypothetical protein [Qipengyuania gaetbuli]MXO51832.1 hypothetical protein [Qipengyuania gaetbuli]